MDDKLLDYNRLELERAHEVHNEFVKQLSSKNLGRENSVQHVILKLVVEGFYDEAKVGLEEFGKNQREFPQFTFRSSRQINHCKDLIQAIKTKRNFPGISTLPKSKQQEILEKVLEHFDELKQYLKQIESLARDVRMSDLRSTIWVIRSGFFSVMSVAVAYLLSEFFRGIHMSFDIITDEGTERFIGWIFSFFT